jgi:multicomponent Na+:H+ antiporter subunit D
MSHRRPNQREAVTLVTAITLFGLVASLIPGVLRGEQPSVDLLSILPGLSLSFTMEPLGALFALIASFLWIVTSVYAIGYMRGHNERKQTRFFFFFAVAIASAIGVAFAGNIFTLLVFYEVLSLSTYPLVTHAGTQEAKKGGRTYLGILLTTSIGLLLPAVIWTWSLVGNLDFRAGGILAGTAGPAALSVLLLLYVFGIGKAALMPFHRWLPAAMVAPTPVSALLHAVAVVKAGVFTVLKVVIYVFGIDVVAELTSGRFLMYVAGATIIVASLVALRQDNLKRRLAYSTVSQLSYIVLAAMLASPLGVMGGTLHVAMHAFGKITLFFCAGAIMVASHKTEVSQLNGIGRRMPWTMGAFALAALSMIGLPPTAGFISKWYILMGAVDGGQVFAAAVLIASTLLNAGYFLPVVYAAFFKPEDPPIEGGGHGHGHVLIHDHGEAPITCVAALTLTAAGTVALFLFPDLALGLARMLIGSPG